MELTRQNADFNTLITYLMSLGLPVVVHRDNTIEGIFGRLGIKWSDRDQLWLIKGDVSLEIANKLYADPLGQYFWASGVYDSDPSAQTGRPNDYIWARPLKLGNGEKVWVIPKYTIVPFVRSGDAPTGALERFLEILRENDPNWYVAIRWKHAREFQRKGTLYATCFDLSRLGLEYIFANDPGPAEYNLTFGGAKIYEIITFEATPAEVRALKEGKAHIDQTPDIPNRVVVYRG